MPIATAKFNVSGTTSYGSKIDQTVTFELEKSSAFNYGNGLCMRMSTDNGADNYFDVRYDTSLRRNGSNFRTWVQEFAKTYFDPNLEVKLLR